MRGSWFAAALVPAVFAGVVYLQAGAQAAPERQPLITEALVDAENGTLTINGFDFGGETPTVTLGMTALPVLSVTESGVVAGLPELLPGTYLLAVSWTDGAGAVFYPTLGAVGPAGPAGPQGEPAPMGPLAGGVSFLPGGLGGAAVGGDPVSSQDHAGLTNTHYGSGALASVTTGRDNSAFGQQALTNMTTGKDNAAFGRVAMRDMLSGEDNLAIGTQAMMRSTTASFNMAFGSGALENNLEGDNNVAIGSAALLLSQGNGNIGIGRDALRLNTDGSGNTAIGYQAGANNRTGSNNVYIGSLGANGEDGIIRIGTEGVHTKTVLVGEVEGDIKVVPVYQ
jgi:hypothetical protein